MQETIEIDTEYITLGQLLKLANIFESGGMIKEFLKERGAIVNNEYEYRRGRKLYDNDVVVITEVGSYLVQRKE